MKCDPTTPAMPTMATGATVPGLYSHIAHSVDKEEGEIPQLFKGIKPKLTRGRGKPNISFKIIIIREAHHNKIVPNTATVINPISRGIMLILIEAEAVALSNSEDAVVVGPTIRITMECISISIIHMTNNRNNTVLPAVYAADLTIPPKHCYKGEHDINNIMEKMSINPHQSQQNNLYQ